MSLHLELNSWIVFSKISSKLEKFKGEVSHKLINYS